MQRRTMLLAAAAGAVTQPLRAQSDYPNKGVRLLVGFAAGGPTDQVARVVAERLTTRLKQPFTVENKPGGNGALAAQSVLASPPDGYTLLVGTSGALTVSPALTKKMSYQPQSLTPVAMLAGYPYALVVASSLPVNNVPQLINYLKKNPKSSFSSSGPGSVNHLAGEWFASMAKIEMIHVPFKGDAASMMDLISGRVIMGFNTLTTAMPQVRAGKLKALAVTSEAPTPLAPGLAPLTSLGFPGFVVEPWNGLLGPTGMQKDVVARINTTLKEILSEPETQARIGETGQYPLIETPEEMRARMEKQSAHWAQIVRKAGIEAE